MPNITIRPEHLDIAERHADPDLWSRIAEAQSPPAPPAGEPGVCRLPSCENPIEPTGQVGHPRAYCCADHEREFRNAHKRNRYAHTTQAPDLTVEILNEQLPPIINEHAGPFRGWQTRYDRRRTNKIAGRVDPIIVALPTERIVRVDASEVGLDPARFPIVLTVRPIDDAEYVTAHLDRDSAEEDSAEEEPEDEYAIVRLPAGCATVAEAFDAGMHFYGERRSSTQCDGEDAAGQWLAEHDLEYPDESSALYAESNFQASPLSARDDWTG